MDKSKTIYFLLFFLFLVFLLFKYIDSRIDKEGFLKIVYLDVGQGSSTYIKTEDGKDILIDAASSEDDLKNLKKYLNFFDRKIDVMIATHQDMDHIGGFLDIVKKYDYELFLFNGNKEDKEEFVFLKKILSNKEKHMKVVSKGDFLVLGKDTYIEFLFPDSGLKDMKSNASSLVFILHHGENKFLFTGDIPKKIENHLALSYAEELNSDVVLVSHHGSKTSTDKYFIDIVSPDFSIISSGKNNSYGHPHQEVLRTLNTLNTNILRTDSLGDIVLHSDGRNIFYKNN